MIGHHRVQTPSLPTCKMAQTVQIIAFEPNLGAMVVDKAGFCVECVPGVLVPSVGGSAGARRGRGHAVRCYTRRVTRRVWCCGVGLERGTSKTERESADKSKNWPTHLPTQFGEKPHRVASFHPHTRGFEAGRAQARLGTLVSTPPLPSMQGETAPRTPPPAGKPAASPPPPPTPAPRSLRLRGLGTRRVVALASPASSNRVMEAGELGARASVGSDVSVPPRLSPPPEYGDLPHHVLAQVMHALVTTDEDEWEARSVSERRGEKGGDLPSFPMCFWLGGAKKTRTLWVARAALPPHPRPCRTLCGLDGGVWCGQEGGRRHGGGGDRCVFGARMRNRSTPTLA